MKTSCTAQGAVVGGRGVRHSAAGTGQTLMEVKTAYGMPLWIATAHRTHMYKNPFSKYGSAYEDMLTM